jgi:8-oxo-dGTP diphosphatase
LEALIRELREEVGVGPTRLHYLASIRDAQASPANPATYHIYLVTDWSGGKLRLLGDEHSEMRWFSLCKATSLPDLALAEYRL